MYQILKKEELGKDTYLIEIEAPKIANAALPGQFVIVKSDDTAERIPLTISDSNLSNGSITLVVKTIGYSTRKIVSFQVGESYRDIVGPLGRPSAFIHRPLSELSKTRYCFIAGGVGIAPIYPLVKWMYAHGLSCDIIVGARTQSLLFFLDRLRPAVRNMYIATDDGSMGEKGTVTDVLDRLVRIEGHHYDEITAIGPMIMMKFVAQKAAEFNIPCVASLNSLMVDGTGMCGACRVTVGGQTRFTCVDGPEFDASLIDFDECMRRQAMYDHIDAPKAQEHDCACMDAAEATLQDPERPARRVPVREQPAEQRKHNFDEVCLGYSASEAMQEARRCLNCKKPICVSGCPVEINIPAFIHQIAIGDFAEAARIISEDSALPAVCGRVCPQETQCEGQCILGKKGEPVAIGKLECFIGDWMRTHSRVTKKIENENGYKVAMSSAQRGTESPFLRHFTNFAVSWYMVFHPFGYPRRRS